MHIMFHYKYYNYGKKDNEEGNPQGGVTFMES